MTTKTGTIKKVLWQQLSRRERYQLARKCGADTSFARRIRDASPPHAQSFLLGLIAVREAMCPPSDQGGV